MKNIETSVSAVLTHEKKPVAAAEEEIEEEECHLMRNEMVFCLKEAPEYFRAILPLQPFGICDSP